MNINQTLWLTMFLSTTSLPTITNLKHIIIITLLDL